GIARGKAAGRHGDAVVLADFGAQVDGGDGHRRRGGGFGRRRAGRFVHRRRGAGVRIEHRLVLLAARQGDGRGQARGKQGHAGDVALHGGFSFGGRKAKGQSSSEGSFSTWPGLIRSGSSSWSRLASKIAFQRFALP